MTRRLDQEPFDVPDEAYEDVTFKAFPQGSGREHGVTVTPLAKRDMNCMHPGMGGGSSGSHKSKAIATGHKRFNEWKLRRRGSLGATPLRQNLSEVRLSEDRESWDQTCSSKEAEQERQPEERCSTSYFDDDSCTSPRPAAAGHGLEPCTTIGPVASLDHHLCTCNSDTQPVEFLDHGTPVKWTIPLPVWPITVEVAVGLRRTAADPSQLPPRLHDPENPQEARSQQQPEPIEPERAAAEALAELIPHLKELFDWSLEVGDEESQAVPTERSISSRTDRLLSAAAARLSHWKSV